MSIQERKEYGEAIALIERHGMVAVTEEHMQRLLAVAEAAETVKEFSGHLKEDGTYWIIEDLMDALAALEEK